MFFSKIFPMLTDTVTYTESCLEKKKQLSLLSTFFYLWHFFFLINFLL